MPWSTRGSIPRRLVNIFLLLLSLATAASVFATDSKYLVFVGTYTGKGSQGIYSYRFDPATGTATPLGLAAESPNPSFLVADSQGRFLYAVNEVNDFNGKPTGGVSAYAIDRETGKLTLLNQVSSLGAGPAHISLDRTGRFVLIANYDAGSVAVYPILKDGKLGSNSAFQQQAGSGADKERQEGPHAHSIVAGPDNRFVLAADLGADKIFIYRFDDKKGTMSPNHPAFATVAPGSGPRHMAFGRSGKFLYLANELTGTVTVFAFDPKSGTLSAKQTISALRENFHGDNTQAEIVIDTAGKFLYVSNRGDATNDITVFRIHEADGTLKFVQRVPSGGKAPRNFAIDPTGRWLLAANQDSNDIQIFRVDQATGQLGPTSKISGIVAPVCVVFVAAK
jgi:6-phosphogluconolactonase